jgi:hypothetical protein
MQKVLELCGLIMHNVGDLDSLPLSNQIVSILQNCKLNDEIYLQKRELLISFIVS